MVVAAPPGFCLDGSATRQDARTTFVRLSDCAGLSPGTRAPRPAVPAILTATIAAAGPGAEPVATSAASLDAYVRSEGGRRALSRAGDAASVEILETFHNDDVFYLHLRDTAPPAEMDVEPTFWRAYVDLPGNIAQLSVLGLRETPLAPEDGVRTLRQFATIMRARNGVTSTTPLAEIDEMEIVEDYTGKRAYEDGDTAHDPFPEPAASPRSRPTHVDPLRALWAIGILRRLL